MSGAATTTPNANGSSKTHSAEKCRNSDTSSDLSSIENVSSWIDEVHDDMLEMAQLKSDFDADKFTRAKEGPFIAHQFHFVMRQYSLALYELRRMLIDKEKHQRRIGELEKLDCEKTEGEYVDLLILENQNAIDLLELSIVNKQGICRNCEKIRCQLLEKNNGPIKNEQYQKEEPEYWKWFLQREAVLHHSAAQTGIPHGIWLNIEHLEQPAMLSEENQVKMLGKGFEHFIQDAAKAISTESQERIE